MHGIVQLNYNLLRSRSWHTKYLNRNSIKNMLISLEKIQLESKLDFAFVSFPHKLSCLDFCFFVFLFFFCFVLFVCFFCFCFCFCFCFFVFFFPQIWLQERFRLLQPPTIPLSTYLPRHLRDC